MILQNARRLKRSKKSLSDFFDKLKSSQCLICQDTGSFKLWPVFTAPPGEVIILMAACRYYQEQIKPGMEAQGESLYLIPAYLVGRHIQLEAGAVAPVYGGGLRLIGVIDHAELAVLHISMDVHVIVGGKPQLELFLAVG